MKRVIKRFIVWYLKRHNVTFEHNNYVVRMFSKGYYDKLMQYADDTRKEKKVIGNENTKVCSKASR